MGLVCDPMGLPGVTTAGVKVAAVLHHYLFSFPLFIHSTSPFELIHEILKLEEHQNLKFWCRLATLWVPYKRAGRGCLLLSSLGHLSL
jgi:hypothetical protein